MFATVRLFGIFAAFVSRVVLVRAFFFCFGKEREKNKNNQKKKKVNEKRYSEKIKENKLLL